MVFVAELLFFIDYFDVEMLHRILRVFELFFDCW